MAGPVVENLALEVMKALPDARRHPASCLVALAVRSLTRCLLPVIDPCREIRLMRCPRLRRASTIQIRIRSSRGDSPAYAARVRST
ncbi:protein of unassigned function [Methylobacterium oryzae CBMB20]|uniref:Protein of unassigned function n=1 Tax=Methylobacterium oryzae CBMB20 TaxID=693986 RepID=A0A089NJT7_9HYPH|nr:protein of unassigned function [Methylobacterium oryzae CBMB20]